MQKVKNAWTIDEVTSGKLPASLPLGDISTGLGRNHRRMQLLAQRGRLPWCKRIDGRYYGDVRLALAWAGIDGGEAQA